MKFHAVWRSTGEPLLLTATLLQVGEQEVTKGLQVLRADLGVSPSVFRDEWAGQWGVRGSSPSGNHCQLLSVTVFTLILEVFG